MQKTYSLPRLLGYVFLLSALFIGGFLLSANSASAADAGEFVFFRVDTELDVLNFRTSDTTNKVTVEWSCSGAASGSIQDNTASESTNTLDGIIKVSSASKEFTDSTCNFTGTKTIRAKSTLGGWVTRRWSIALPASGSAPFSNGASMDYDLVVNGARDELGNALTMDGTTSSASWNNGGTVASQSYSGGKKYIAVSAAGTSTVVGGADGYVNSRASVSFSDFVSSSKSVDFDNSQTSTVDGTPLSFGVKVTANGYISRTGQSVSITSGSVTAGNSGTISCTASGGSYYCAVPLAHTGTTATISSTGLANPSATTCTYTDRALGSDSQSTCTISAVEASGVGSSADTGSSGGGNNTTVVITTPTPTPTPDIMMTPTPTPTPSFTPTPTPYYNPTPTPYPSKPLLFRKAKDPKIYVQQNDGTLHWIKTAAEFTAAGYSWADVKQISGNEFAQKRIGGQLRVVKNVSFLRVRNTASIKGKVIGQLSPNQLVDFSDSKNGWYKVKMSDGSYGWVSGGYIKEQ